MSESGVAIGMNHINVVVPQTDSKNSDQDESRGSKKRSRLNATGVQVGAEFTRRIRHSPPRGHSKNSLDIQGGRRGSGEARLDDSAGSIQSISAETSCPRGVDGSPSAKLAAMDRGESGGDAGRRR